MNPDDAQEGLAPGQDESAAEKAVRDFGAACRANPSEDIAPHLRDMPDRLGALVAMAKIAIRVAWEGDPRPEAKGDRRADRAWVEYYLDQYKELRGHDSLVKELISAERGCRPDAETSCDHYRDRFPAYSAVV